MSVNNVVGGIHAVSAVLRNESVVVVRLQVAADRGGARIQTLLDLAAQRGVPVSRVDARDLDRRHPQLRHQGVVATCESSEPLSEPKMLDLLAGLPQAGLVLVLDGVTDPHNLGALLRTADAAGVDCVLCTRAGSAGIGPVVRKVASGAVESVPLCYVANLARSLVELKSLGYWLFGASDAAGQAYTEFDYRGPVALLVGSEEAGLRRLTRHHCDMLVNIPMAGTVSSLNVSVAAGVCLYEVVRQRRTAANG